MKKGVDCYIKNYPRPQMVRKEWNCLDGEWSFLFDDNNRGEREKWNEVFPESSKIVVPYTYETICSEINENRSHRYVWYSKKLDFDFKIWGDRRILLHFEGSDYRTTVWVNGKKAGVHEGGYARFSYDITDYIEESENVITVKAEDFFNTQQPRGKQRWREESFRCWYIQTTGIWKSVWMEPINEKYISRIKMTPKQKERKISINLEVENICQQDEISVEISVYYDQRKIACVNTQISEFILDTDIDITYIGPDSEFTGIHSWSPEEPCLYDIAFRLLRGDRELDCVGSYFGMRDITTENGKILLNGSPLYQRLILDQGYWEETGLTPPSEKALLEDIEKTLALGYNGIRKHQKTEDERFLYWCDVKGLLVWCEMPSTYMFGDRAVQNVNREWIEIVGQNYNHPAIIVWTAFNESWGINEVRDNLEQQHFTENIYHLIKALDGTRPVITNDGWEHTISDIITLHDYEENVEIFKKRYNGREKEILQSNIYHNLLRGAFAKGYEYKGQPIIISEYGGIAFQDGQKGWGYGNKAETKEAYIHRFEEMTTAIKELSYVCGYCYTQLTDVYQEINGILDVKRNYKIKPDIIKEINKRRVNFLTREE